MPLMSRRRSTLDNLLNDIRTSTQEDAATQSSGYATPVPNTLRPMSAQDPISPSDVLSLGPPSPPIQTATPATARFSMLRWRHFSDGQLSAKAKLHADAEKNPSGTSSPASTSIANPCAEPSDHHHCTHYG